jgi:hypothetical protein
MIGGRVDARERVVAALEAAGISSSRRLAGRPGAFANAGRPAGPIVAALDWIRRRSWASRRIPLSTDLGHLPAIGREQLLSENRSLRQFGTVNAQERCSTRSRRAKQLRLAFTFSWRYDAG